MTDHPKLNGLGDNKKRKQPCSNELGFDKGGKGGREKGNQRKRSFEGAELRETEKKQLANVVRNVGIHQGSFSCPNQHDHVQQTHTFQGSLLHVFSKKKINNFKNLIEFEKHEQEQILLSCLNIESSN